MSIASFFAGNNFNFRLNEGDSNDFVDCACYFVPPFFFSSPLFFARLNPRFSTRAKNPSLIGFLISFGFPLRSQTLPLLSVLKTDLLC